MNLTRYLSIQLDANELAIKFNDSMKNLIRPGYWWFANVGIDLLASVEREEKSPLLASNLLITGRDWPTWLDSSELLMNDDDDDDDDDDDL